MRSLLLALTLLCTLTFLAFLNANEPRLKIIDANTGLPIEGALVHDVQQERVYRSNIDGLVAMPLSGPAASLQISAKNYRTADISFEDLFQTTIPLKFDSSYVYAEEAALTFTRADSVRGGYNRYRSNNDLTHYDLQIRVDIENKYLSGRNTIRFDMLQDDRLIQIDLYDNMSVDSIVYRGQHLPYSRDFNAVMIELPSGFKKGRQYSLDFYYSGNPKETGRFGGLAFQQDSLGNPWVFTACQGIGASLWWPNKDQQADEVDSMRMRVAVPEGLIDASNGRLMARRDLGDGYVEYDWKIHYPINNYCVSLNIAPYTHYSDTLGDLTIDYYVQPYNLEKARKQFQQVKPMLRCFESYFGDYPFMKDGFKLIEVPYSGMEHQSAVTYGNQFRNGYLGRDWTGVGVSLKFDFIIIHESGHEWFGNSVTCNDVSDAWIQEGWCTYSEAVYVECMFGYEDALRYVNGYAEKVKNTTSIIGPTAVNHWPTSDQYFKGALIMNTLRHIVDNDDTWWALIRRYADHFKYQNIYTSDVINFFNKFLDRDLTAVFRQYLYYAALPRLQLQKSPNGIRYRWVADVPEFDMPVRIRHTDGDFLIHPKTEWITKTASPEKVGGWQVADDQFYIQVEWME